MAESSSSLPQGPGLQLLAKTVSSLCSVRHRTLIMTGIFRDVLMRHFADPAHIEEPDLRHLVFRNQVSEGMILIETVHRWNPQMTEFRPGVLVKRNAYQNQRRGLGDRQQGNAADQYGDEHFETFWVGSHTLFCIGGSGAQAELLGAEVQRELTEFGPAIAFSLDLLRLQVTQVGAVAELEEAQENYVVPVTVGYGFSESWILRQRAPRLEQLSLSLLTEC